MRIDFYRDNPTLVSDTTRAFFLNLDIRDRIVLSITPDNIRKTDMPTDGPGVYIRRQEFSCLYDAIVFITKMVFTPSFIVREHLFYEVTCGDLSQEEMLKICGAQYRAEQFFVVAFQNAHNAEMSRDRTDENVECSKSVLKLAENTLRVLSSIKHQLAVQCTPQEVIASLLASAEFA